MSRNMGKPSGKYAEDKRSPGRKGDYKRSGWPEDADTQRVDDSSGQQTSARRPVLRSPGTGQGRNRKAGSPV
jgi:hypothetical protein